MEDPFVIISAGPTKKILFTMMTLQGLEIRNFFTKKIKKMTLEIISTNIFDLVSNARIFENRDQN